MTTDTPVATKTIYVVLQGIPPTEVMPGSGDDNSFSVTSFSPVDMWRELGRVDADSADSAIKQIADSTDRAFTGYAVAIPARSFRPVKVTVETVSKVKLEDA